MSVQSTISHKQPFMNESEMSPPPAGRLCEKLTTNLPTISNCFLYRLDRHAVVLYLAVVRSGVGGVYPSFEVPRLPLGRNHRNRHPRNQLHGLLLRRYVHLSLRVSSIHDQK